MTDYDPRLVAFYDDDNPDGPDHDFFRGFADGLGATSILDLGCGTGILTVTLAGSGRQVVGIDPSPAMLDVARSRPGSDAVTWILGDSDQIAPGAFDLAIMSGNVAQHIVGDAWARTLANLRRGMRAQGTLLFESRNPLARAWEGWTSAAPTVRDTGDGPLEEWYTAPEVAPGLVELTAFNRFLATGELVTETQQLAFRSAEQISTDLEATGFVVEDRYGGWTHEPWTPNDPLMVFVAIT